MSTEGSQNAISHRSHTGESKDFVRMGTRVPSAVREHYVTAARRHGVSLSVYLERLSQVDPLAHAPLETGKGSEKT